MSGIYDTERKKIDLVVLHHSVTPESYTWRDLSRIGKSRTYQGYPHSYHYDPETKEETFIDYHYLIYRDGSYRKCLEDKDIAWNCGNWEKNTRSIAICFVGDYTKYDPTEEQLQAAADIIRPYDKAVGGKLLVLLHKEIVPTACPARVSFFRDKIVDLVNRKPQVKKTKDWKKEYFNLKKKTQKTEKALLNENKSLLEIQQKLNRTIIEKNNEFSSLKLEIKEIKKQKIEENQKLLDQLKSLEEEKKNEVAEYAQNERKYLEKVQILENELRVKKRAYRNSQHKLKQSGELIRAKEEKIKELEDQLAEIETIRKELALCEEGAKVVLKEKNKLLKEVEKLKNQKLKNKTETKETVIWKNFFSQLWNFLRKIHG